jgi:acetyl-CoA carboxylase biotin carboxyl carrier protein
MDFKEIQELLRLISKLELKEFKLKEGEFELSVRTKFHNSGREMTATSFPIHHLPAPSSITAVEQSTMAPAPAPAAVAPASDTAAPAPAAQGEGNYVPIKSPIVGTFYRSPTPEKPAYVKVGDKIETGTVVCIIEAMKLFNEIESDVSGRIVKVLVEDAQPVEYDQVLFLIDPRG